MCSLVCSFVETRLPSRTLDCISDELYAHPAVCFIFFCRYVFLVYDLMLIICLIYLTLQRHVVFVFHRYFGWDIVGLRGGQQETYQ